MFKRPTLARCIDKQFRARDVAGVVGCKKDQGFCDFIGCTESTERNSVEDHRLPMLAGF